MDRQIDLDVLRSRWRAALSAAEAAITAVGGFSARPPCTRTAGASSEEYAPTVGLLQAFAHDEGLPLILAQPFLPRPEAQRLLRLPAGVSACIFNLDGVLVGSAAVHAAAWKRTFDEFLTDRTGPDGAAVAQFDPSIDYPPTCTGGRVSRASARSSPAAASASRRALPATRRAARRCTASRTASR